MTNNGEIGTASKKEKRHILEKQIEIKKSQTHNGERETERKKVRTRQKEAKNVSEREKEGKEQYRKQEINVSWEDKEREKGISRKCE